MNVLGLMVLCVLVVVASSLSCGIPFGAMAWAITALSGFGLP